MKRILINIQAINFLLLLFLSVFIPKHTIAQEAISYSDNDLFEKGLKEYNRNNYKAAAIFLYAYIQRKPGQISNEVNSAYKYSLARTTNGIEAGTKGDGTCECEIKHPDNNNKPGVQNNSGEHNPAVTIKSVGYWNCDDGGTYFIRQVGNEVWWYGQSSDSGKSWSNVFNGQISGNLISGKWSDIPHGAAANSGEITIQIINSRSLKIVTKTGVFGGNTWTSPLEGIKTVVEKNKKVTMQSVKAPVRQ